jgi:hypothetical protein
MTPYCPVEASALRAGPFDLKARIGKFLDSIVGATFGSETFCRECLFDNPVDAANDLADFSHPAKIKSSVPVALRCHK